MKPESDDPRIALSRQTSSHLAGTADQHLPAKTLRVGLTLALSVLALVALGALLALTWGGQ